MVFKLQGKTLFFPIDALAFLNHCWDFMGFMYVYGQRVNMFLGDVTLRQNIMAQLI